MERLSFWGKVGLLLLVVELDLTWFHRNCGHTFGRF